MSPSNQLPAPGGPGLEPRWTSSAKSGVGTAFDGRSLVWFTVSHGILDEIYYPRVDQANTRDFGWRSRSCGYVGVNDGWRLLRDQRQLIEYTEARNGNVALTGEVDLAATARIVGNDRVAEFVLALGFGSGPAEAAQRARMTL